MGLLSKLAGGRGQKLDAFLAEQMESDEQAVAALPMCQVETPAFSAAGQGFVFYGIAATDRNVHFVGWSTGLPERPKQLVASHARESVSIAEYKPGRLSTGKLVLRIDHGEPVSFEVPALHRGEANALVKALRGTT